jgi:hypothetical protein
LKNTVSEANRFSLDTRVGSSGGGGERASIVGNKGAVSIFLNQVNVVVVDQVLDNNTGRVNNKNSIRD